MITPVKKRNGSYVFICLLALIIVTFFQCDNVKAQNDVEPEAQTSSSNIDYSLGMTETTVTGRGVYEEIIEESGVVTPGLPGSLDEFETTVSNAQTTSSNPTVPEDSTIIEETMEPIVEPTTSEMNNQVSNGTSTSSQNVSTSVISRIIRGGSSNSNNNQSLVKESEAYSVSLTFIKNYLQSQFEVYPKVHFWQYAILTIPTFELNLLKPVVIPLVVVIFHTMSIF